MDRLGPKWTYGPNRTNRTKNDQSGLNRTIVDGIGPSGMDLGGGLRGPGSPLGPKFFFLVCKIFKKGGGGAHGLCWFLARVPLGFKLRPPSL